MKKRLLVIALVLIAVFSLSAIIYAGPGSGDPPIDLNKNSIELPEYDAQP